MFFKKEETKEVKEEKVKKWKAKLNAKVKKEFSVP
jgi:hypothetical protein